MTAEDALLAAVCADPDADTPRLVYADWLDDRGQDGDAARAEVDDLGGQVSAGRRAAADGFAAEVGRELAGLAMRSARVSFSVDSDPGTPGPEGIDE